MGLPRNVLDNVPGYVGLLTDPEKGTRADPPDGSMINGRYAVDDAEERLIAEARAQQRAACAAIVAGIGRDRK